MSRPQGSTPAGENGVIHSVRRQPRSRRTTGNGTGRMRYPRRLLGIFSDLLMWLAAVGGAICLSLVIAAYVFNVSLIMFATGSMSPTISAGSVALVREIPASEAKIGDIITVDRPGDLPVTHRVVSTEPMNNGQWKISMKGDANEQPDPFPYLVVTVRQTIGHLPGLASAIVWFGSPWVLGSLTLGAAGLVTWAFWPRSQNEGVKA